MGRLDSVLFCSSVPSARQREAVVERAGEAERGHRPTFPVAHSSALHIAEVASNFDQRLPRSDCGRY